MYERPIIFLVLGPTLLVDLERFHDRIALALSRFLHRNKLAVAGVTASFVINHNLFPYVRRGKRPAPPGRRDGDSHGLLRTRGLD